MGSFTFVSSLGISRGACLKALLKLINVKNCNVYQVYSAGTHWSENRYFAKQFLKGCYNQPNYFKMAFSITFRLILRIQMRK